MTTHYLSPLFEPKSVALFGASPKPDSVGGVLFSNLTRGGFEGSVFPINPKYAKIKGKVCHASILNVDEAIDLAVIATPSRTIPEILSGCAQRAVRSAVILSAGFREIGPEGRALEETIRKTARQHRIRFLGPNCLGLMRTSIHLNATFYRGRAQAGTVALVSQSGAICTSILDWADLNAVGFSSVISTGGSADLDFGEILDFLATDSRTESILLYIEGIRDARRFMSGLRAAARIKPVIVLKAGKFRSGSQAALSHTGALVGADDVFEAALRRAGAVRVQTNAQLFAAAETLSAGRPAQGSRLAIVTNGGGLGVLAADAATQLGIPLSDLEPSTRKKLDEILPPAWSHGNPMDILGDAPRERYQQVLEAIQGDSTIDGMVVMLAPQAMTQPLEAARAVVAAYQATSKPLIACWMGGKQTRSSHTLLAKARIPCVDSPMAAIEAFSFLVAHHQNQRVLLETPGPLEQTADPDIVGARMICSGALQEKRQVLTMLESKAVLAAFRIPISGSVLVRSPAEALVCAEEFGFPVVLKVNSSVLTHKTDVKGVRLNIPDAPSLLSAYQEIFEDARKLGVEKDIDGLTVERMIVRPNARELMLGVKKDPIFGPVISFGLGGTLVEILQDHRVLLPPLNERIIHRALAGSRVEKILGEFRRRPPADLAHLVQILLHVSEMVCELPMIKEMDLNPVLVDDQGAIVVDARIAVTPGEPLESDYSHLSIHPYPSHLERTWHYSDGTPITIRPIRPEDAQIEDEFVERLSERSKYFRFMGHLNKLSRTMLVRFTQIDYDQEMAFIATLRREGREEEIAVGRYLSYPDGETCEFAIVVADEWQGKGLGRQIMTDLIRTARKKGLKTMRGDILRDNAGMNNLAVNLGFVLNPHPADTAVNQAVLDLTTGRD